MKLSPSYRVDVLEHCGVFYPFHVGRDDGLHPFSGEVGGELSGLARVVGADGEVAQAFEGHLLRVARAPDHHQVAFVASEAAHEIVRNDEVGVRHHPFHGRHYLLCGDVGGDLLGLGLEIGRGDGHDERVGVQARLVDVGGEVDAGRVEAHVGEVGRVAPVFYEVVDALAPAEIPYQAVRVVEQELGEGGGPAPGAYHRYFA